MRQLTIGVLVTRALLGLALVSALVGAVLLARPALDVEHGTTSVTPEAAEGS
ncbi:hypothetical protein SUDANB171_01072 [Streptomyces sp. enrichment culture]|jgi:hypothetical protein|uniref:hypothetical protein n=1 Tax=Streptomyces xiamenensis TaxID=408015 RepID=UPI0036EF1C2F